MSFTVALLLSAITSFPVSLPGIEQVRLLYSKAAIEEQKCKELLQLLKPVNKNDPPVLNGYKACATMMMAKHVFNPFNKLSYFNKGKRMLENSIAADPLNIELRYLRYAVQKNAPAFLGYRNNLSSDRNFLEKNRHLVKEKKLSDMIAVVLAK